jgi:hypothetical protein
MVFRRLWERTMIRKLLAVLSTGAIGVAGEACADSWRNGLELIDQWSIFTCPVIIADRYWDFTLEGSRLSALGPEGAKWTAEVARGGSFHTTFSGLWRGRPFDGEVRGNVTDRWAILHNRTAMCWYRLEPATVDAAPVKKRSEWTSVSAVFRGDAPCRVEALARISEQPGVLRLTIVDGAVQTQLDVALTADGSGQAEYASTNGTPARLEVPAGAGERILRSTLSDDTCQWIWEPT